MSGGKMRERLAKWWKRFWRDTRMARDGVRMVMQKPWYVVLAVVVFLVFAYFFAMFADGTSTWSLLWSGIPMADKVGLLGNVWGVVVGNFVDAWGLVLLLLAALQGLCIALLVYSVRAKISKKTMASGVEAGGVGAAIGLVALGCPTCGTSLLTPLLTMMLGSSAMAMVGVIGSFLTVAALLLLAYATWQLGRGIYYEANGICKKKALKKRRKNVAKN